MLAASLRETASDRHGNLMTAKICREPAWQCPGIA